MALMEDERLILRWLSQYGPLRWLQIRGLLYYRPQRSVNRLVQNMKHARRIAAIEDGEYLAVDQYCEPKQRMITAVWVLLQFIEQIDPEAHWQADAPAQVSFLKDKTAYEIVVLYEDEDHLVRLLQPQGDTKYILVVPNMEFANKLILPDAPCLFATVDQTEYEAPNEICDELIRNTRLVLNEQSTDTVDVLSEAASAHPDPLTISDLRHSIGQAKAKAQGGTARGIQCLELTVQGHTSKKIGAIVGANPGTVRMWITRARKDKV